MVGVSKQLENYFDSIRELTDASIDVITVSEARNGSTKSNSQSWNSFLPNIDEKKVLREPLAKFREFLQCTNQLELLMRDAEIFAYRISDRKSKDGAESIFIEERERERRVPEFCQVKGGMLEFLQREWDSGRKDCKLFLLSEENSLRVGTKQKNEAWEIVRINGEEGYAELSRAISNNVGLSPLVELKPRTRVGVARRRHRQAAAMVVKSKTREVLKNRFGDKAKDLLKSDFEISGSSTKNKFDVVVANGKPYFAAHGISFEVHVPDSVKESVLWRISDVKKLQPNLAMPTAGYAYAIVVLPPKEETDNYQQHQNAYQQTTATYKKLGADVVDENEIEPWVSQKLEYVTV